MKWLLLIIKSTNVSSRDRMFIWRKIKNTVAVPLSHSVYLLQDTEENRVTASNITRIVHERNGEVLQFFADTSNKEQEQKLNELIAQEVITEIKEYSKLCRDFIADVNQCISKKSFEVLELEELNDDLHQLDKIRIKLIQKYKPDSNKIVILSKEIGKCKEKLNEFEEKIHQINEV
jgi:DNA repair ATPase RecN